MAHGGDRMRDQEKAGVALYGLLSGVVRRVPRDMSLTAASIMSTLERTGPRRITDLAIVQGVTQPSMTVLVKSSERSGLVERQLDRSNKRVTLVTLTDLGVANVEDRRRQAVKAFGQLIEKLPRAEVSALIAAI